MKVRILLVVGLAALFGLPALGNDPSMSGGNSGTGMSNTNPNRGRNNTPRKRWVRKRIRELQPKIEQGRGADRTATEMDRFQAAIDNRPVRVIFPQGLNNQEKLEYMKARYEQLALKAELGRASPKEIAELRALQPFVLHRSH